MKTRYLTSLLIAASLLVGHADAQESDGYYDSSATIGSEVDTALCIGFGSANDFNYDINPASPTVTLVDGGSIPGAAVYNSSTLNIEGGQGGAVALHDGASVNMSGGEVGSFGGSSGSITMSGGIVYATAGIFGDMSFTVTGGEIGYAAVNPPIQQAFLHLYDASSSSLAGCKIDCDTTTGGSAIVTANKATFLGSLTLNNNSSFTDNGSTFSNGIYVNNLADAAFTSSKVTGGLDASGGTTSFEASTIDSVYAAGAAVTLNNTTVGSAATVVNSSVLIQGGSVAQGIDVYRSAPTSLVTDLSISGGTLIGGNIGTHSYSTTKVAGSTISGNVTLSDNSSLAGTDTTIVQDVSMTEQTALSLTGGSVGGISSTSTSTVTLTNTAVLGDVDLTNGSATITDTKVSGALSVKNANVVALGTTASSPLAFDSASLVGSTVTMTNANVSNNVVDDGGTLTYAGGNIGGLLLAYQTLSNAACSVTLDGGVDAQSGIDAGDASTVDIKNATIENGASFYGNDSATMEDGTVVDGVSVSDNASFNLKGGTVDAVTASGNAGFLLTGGTVFGDVNIGAGAKMILSDGGVTGTVKVTGPSTTQQFQMTGGDVENLTLAGSTGSVQGGTIYDTLTVNGKGAAYFYTGASAANIAVADSANFTMSGGTVSQKITAQNSAHVIMGEGATVARGLSAYDTSVVDMQGGQLGQGSGSIILLTDSSTLNFSGGLIDGWIDIDDNATFNWTGGSLEGRITDETGSFAKAFAAARANTVGDDATSAFYLEDDAQAIISGANLTRTQITSDIAGDTEYAVSGTLEDGTVLNDFDIYVQNGGGAGFTFQAVAVAPEPSTTWLAAISILALFPACRRFSRARR